MGMGEVQSPGLKRKGTLHRFFEVGVFVKGVDGTLQLVGGIVLLFLSPAAINAMALFFIEGELQEDPTDLVANLLLHATQNVIQLRLLASAFLIAHGAVKLLLVGALARNRLWSYPAAIVVFSGFVVYQVHQLSHQYSFFLVTVTGVDVLFILLVILEYRHVKTVAMRAP